ncbi:Membrane-bound lytic murein transglycosylase B [Actinokineospora alba]|uniref:Membrane-bound lytic murein transglycosylase B n=1 Tax=Actinokineospora alba TaxID=504798 RepID=A0A1H0N2F1_9PSEU|nr:lytic murein transglycosylase [Actinokineospora alba]TDP68533.1 membrane-bound lytic murein transglycosylase B [Actinokineospora alba]SDH81115.1 Membrane-bound lytic murein transglycosylase B [Actinokineospora alba]SDO86791.1 Membrane-bound lytic murein transglycosylase B [Actinokineospora alba]
MADTNTPVTRRGAGILVRLLVVVLVMVVGVGVVWLVRVAATPQAMPVEIPALEVQAAPVEPGSVVPAGTDAGVAQQPPPRPQAGASGADVLRTWAEKLAGPTGVPARALMAYGNAELVVRSTTPKCRLSWATLAGIGRIESNHGRYGGATLGEDGRPSKPIIGVPLDGSPGVKAISDTDGGMFDGDNQVDRAVGPMQFIPSTWKRWASDANLDGRGDPQQIDDAALAAGRYLCANGRDMGSAAGWWAGVFSYNNSVPYGQKVFGLADGYARTAA